LDLRTELDSVVALDDGAMSSSVDWLVVPGEGFKPSLPSRGPGDRTVQLYRVTGPRQYQVVNALPAAVASGSYVMIAGVAPDDSAVVALANGSSGRRRFYLMPTDGSPPTTLDGEFAGFVPTTLIDFLT
jgi:hypothetical protein